jgi:multiple sugar transport system permease protein
VRRYTTAALFMSPWIIGFSVFILYPALASLYYSFTNYDLLSTPSFVGLENYRFMFTKDPQFWQAMRNTIWMICVGVPLSMLVALGTAMLLTRPRRGVKSYRTILFLPTMAPPVAAALAFFVIFNPATGPVNRCFASDQNRLVVLRSFWSKWAVVPRPVGGDDMIIYLAGLLDVPRQLYEAADIEGASPWQKFRHVTFPSLSPVLFFTLVIGVIAGFQYFTQAYVASFAVSGQATEEASAAVGSPQGSLLFYSIYLYLKGFSDFRMGYASAMAWMLLLLTLACTALLIRSSRHWVHYQAGGFR